MSLLVRGAWVAFVANAGCQPAAFPRTGEVVEAGRFAAEVHLQTAVYEPQRTVTTDGRALRAEVGFIPALVGGARMGVGGCEIGGVYGMTRLLGEARCGVIQERRGAPLSVALAGAVGLDYGPVTGAVARVGVDVSRRLGPFRPLVDVYVSTANQYRYMEDPGDPPIEGPLPGSKSVIRQEVRITVPVGLAIELVPRDPSDRMRPTWSLVLGANPFAVLHAPAPCARCLAWNGNAGVGFVVGLEAR